MAKATSRAGSKSQASKKSSGAKTRSTQSAKSPAGSRAKSASSRPKPIDTLPKPSSYCDAILRWDKDNVHVHYHDKEYGFPIEDDNELFARLVLEINQAGLSWTTILNKKDNFFKAFDDFNIAKVARYGQKQTDRLLQDAGIIRNRLKIDATIGNARRIQALQKEYGSFKNWLDHHHPLTKEEWVKLFKQTFRFTGGEIVNSFLMSIGYLPGAHVETCPIYKKLLKIKPKPAWLSGKSVTKTSKSVGKK